MTIPDKDEYDEVDEIISFQFGFNKLKMLQGIVLALILIAYIPFSFFFLDTFDRNGTPYWFNPSVIVNYKAEIPTYAGIENVSFNVRCHESMGDFATSGTFYHSHTPYYVHEMADGSSLLLAHNIPCREFLTGEKNERAFNSRAIWIDSAQKTKEVEFGTFDFNSEKDSSIAKFDANRASWKIAITIVEGTFLNLIQKPNLAALKLFEGHVGTSSREDSKHFTGLVAFKIPETVWLTNETHRQVVNGLEHQTNRATDSMLVLTTDEVIKVARNGLAMRGGGWKYGGCKSRSLV